MAIDATLCCLDAVEALRLFRRRELSPVELLEAQIARIEAVNPQLNALTATYFDRALSQAAKAESRYQRGEGLRPLEGLTVAIKDFHSVEGEITTYGSYVFDGHRPAYTAPTVRRLLDAGAIMTCRTTTPEFASSATTHSPRWGVTRNPWNIRFSPGGSSGGSAVAVATGMATLADGTDGGGSIRIPASACGIVGYLPPFGRNPVDRDHPIELLLRYGPLTRSVADAALMQNVMSGPHPDDMGSLRERLVLPDSFPDIRGWRVALSVDLGYFEVDPEVAAATRAAARVFADLGCVVEEVSVGWSLDCLDAFYTYWEGMAATLLAPLLPQWRDRMNPHVVHVVEKGLGHSATDLYKVNDMRGRMQQAIAPILESYDLLISPTLAVPSVRADHSNMDAAFEINGRRVDAYLQWVLTYPFNMVSWIPAISVPNGCSRDGVPIGLHIAARSYDDLRVFRGATAFERANPWRERRLPL
ncbi:MAG: amidase family protein [Dongiaceae bacterium]